METSRLFLATFVDNNLFQKHYLNIQHLFEPACNGKWTELHNLHFTYKFLGNVDNEKILEIAELLNENTTDYAANLKFNGLGVLNHVRNPRVLYARVFSPDKSVLNNFNEIEKKLTKFGFPREKQKFLPHISLLRIKKFNEHFESVFEKNKDMYIGKQINYKIRLVSSKLTQECPIYSVIS